MKKTRGCRVVLAGLVVLILLHGSSVVRADHQRPMRTISLEIVRVKQIDNVDATKGGEFYARVRINGLSFPKTGHREDRRDVRPGWTFVAIVREIPGVPISIDIYDQDFPDSDDHCDASPVDGRKRLSISYNVTTRDISGDATGHGGELIHVRGAGDGNRVEVWFRVSQAQ